MYVVIGGVCSNWMCCGRIDVRLGWYKKKWKVCLIGVGRYFICMFYMFFGFGFVG